MRGRGEGKGEWGRGAREGASLLLLPLATSLPDNLLSKWPVAMATWAAWGDAARL